MTATGRSESSGLAAAHVPIVPTSWPERKPFVSQLSDDEVLGLGLTARIWRDWFRETAGLCVVTEPVDGCDQGAVVAVQRWPFVIPLSSLAARIEGVEVDEVSIAVDAVEVLRAPPLPHLSDRALARFSVPREEVERAMGDRVWLAELARSFGRRHAF